MQTNYKEQPWRYIFLPIEGVLLLTFLPLTTTAAAVPSMVWRISKFAWEKVTEVAEIALGVGKAISDKMYFDKEAKTIRKRKGDVYVNETRHFRFYKKGLFHVLVAFLLASIAILIVGAVGLAATIIVAGISIAAIAASFPLTLGISFIAPLAIAIIFSIMAFLRLFVIFPSVWKELYHLAAMFALPAGKLIGILDEDRIEDAKGQVFKIYEGRSRGDDDDQKAELKDSTIKYLFVEFILEAVPQIIVQALNNQATGNWSIISIVSMALSGTIILNSAFKYGCLYYGGESE